MITKTKSLHFNIHRTPLQFLDHLSVSQIDHVSPAHRQPRTPAGSGFFRSAGGPVLAEEAGGEGVWGAVMFHAHLRQETLRAWTGWNQEMPGLPK